MVADMYAGRGGFVEAKGTDIWTDVIIVGGSVPHDTGGNVQYIYGSGASQTAKFGTATITTGVITTGSITSERVGQSVIVGSITATTAVVTTGSITTDRIGQMVVVGSIQSRSLGVPMISAGSPVASANYLIQIGQSGTAAGSIQWVDFPEKYGSATNLRVIAGTNVGTAGSGWTGVGSISAGSFWAATEYASTTFDWIAIGTRA